MTTGSGTGPLVPTFHGFVHNSMDGLVLFEGCLSGKLHHVPRRPHDRERSSLIKSGSIFIYEENASGIKRWTDGVAWSPSRILGNFLIYRELEKPFPPGEKKRAMKRKRTSMPGEPYPTRRDSDDVDANDLTTPLTPPTPTASGEVKPDVSGTDQDKELERSLIGSLVDSYGFRPDGLVKKTMSISVNGISHHMVSYYKVDDVKNNLLPRPLSDPRLQNVSVRPELYLKQNFRAPVEETEPYAIDQQMHAHPHMMYSSMQGGAYAVRPGQYFGQQQYPQYALSTSAPPGVYGSSATAGWSMSQPPNTAMSYSTHPSYQGQYYSTGDYKPAQPPAGPPSVKSEDHAASQPPSSYGNHYSSAYPSLQRNGSQSSASMMPSSYSTQVQQQPPSAYGSMSAAPRHPYPTPSMSTPASSGAPQQQMYASSTASSHPYAVRSPTQSYSMHSAPPSAVAPSPQMSGGLKSPHPSAANGSSDSHLHSSASHMQYRPSTYAVPPTPQSTTGHHSGSEMNGLGINSSGYSSGPSAPNGQSYHHAYASSDHAYRPVSEVGAAHAGAQYAQ